MGDNRKNVRLMGCSLPIRIGGLGGYPMDLSDRES